MAEDNTQAQAQDPVAQQAAPAPEAQAAPAAPAATATATPPAPAAPAAEAPAQPAQEQAAPAATAVASEPAADYKAPLQNAIIAGNIPQIVMYAISHALTSRTSDIHIEPEEKTVRMRYRVDGVLHHIIEYPSNIHPAVISRIKIMSGLKIDEQRIPQDGRTQVTTEDRRSIDLRVSSLPTVNGEKIVMRLQDKTKKIPDLPDLGINPVQMEMMERFLKTPNGVFLVTGPTGSGKTNTLYSTLSRLNTDGVNIMTFEDPVEYQMDGLNQSQVKPEIEYDFSMGLRTALRQDPDIIMVGEIRDQETVEIAVRAALTGHLVLSTLHTNSAVATITRILDMGVKPFLITSSVRGIIAQRLVRRLSEEAKEQYTPEPSVIEDIKKELEGIPEGAIDPKLLENPVLYRVKEGMEENGFKGRVGVFEIMEMKRELGELILSGANENEIVNKAKEQGMMTLLQDGLIKALQGLTTLEEVYRITR